MKLFKYIIRCTVICLLIASHENKAAPDKIQLTEEDIATLEAMGFSRADAIETANVINNMSPDEQNALAQIGQQVAQDMNKAGLDPNDPEQMVNFISKQEARPTPPPAPQRREEPSFVQPSTQQAHDQKTQAPVKNPFATADIDLILKETLKHLASLRQKRQTSDHLAKFGPELDTLAYNLNVINRPELFPYITSQEFSSLYSLLEQLHRVLLTYEPRITAIRFFEEDEIENPYAILQLPLNARPKEIESAYRKLKQKHDPEILAKTERVKKLSKKERERLLTEAKLSFIEIKAAYESLKNPKEKADIDRALSEYQALEEKNEQLSDSAFDSLVHSIEQILRQRLLADINNLLKKYSPEEKKKLDEWEKQRLSALDISKKEYESALARGRTPRVITLPGKEDVGEKFWREFRIPESSGRSGGYQPGISSMPSSYEPPRITAPAFGDHELPKETKRPTGDTGAKPGAPKEEKKEKESDKGDKPKEAPKTFPEPVKEKESELSDLEKFSITELMHPTDFKTFKKLVDEPELEKILTGELPRYLSKPAPAPLAQNGPAEPAPVLKKIDELIQKSRLSQIEADYEELAKKVSDPKTKPAAKNEYKKIWQEVQTKFGSALTKLYQLIFDNLDPLHAPARSKAGVLQNPNHQAFELLNLADKEQAKKLAGLKASGQPFVPGQPGFLGNFKATIYRLHDLSQKITKSLGGSDKPAPKK